MATRTKEPFIFTLFTLVVPFNVLVDFVSYFVYDFSQGITIKWLAVMRGAILLLLIIYSLPRILRANRNNTVSHCIYFFTFYILLILPFAENFDNSLRVSTIVLLSSLMYPLGYSMVTTNNRLNLLLKSVSLPIIILVVRVLSGYLFGLESGNYSQDIKLFTAGVEGGYLNIMVYLLLLVLLAVNLNNVSYKLSYKQRIFYLLSIILLLIILLISVKRIAIASFVLGIAIFFILTGRIAFFLKYAFLTGAFLVFTYPIYGELLKKQIESREERFEPGWVETEGRYLETPYVWKEVFSFNDPFKSLFGLRPFDSVGNYAEGKFGYRQLHVDYNLVVNTCGIVGFLLFLMIYFSLYLNYRKYKRSYSRSMVRSKQVESLLAIVFILSFLPLFTSISGGMYDISYRSTVFLFLGGFSRWLNDNSECIEFNTPQKLDS